MKTPKMVYH